MKAEKRVHRPSAILCADWGKEVGKRAVYVADVSARAVRRADARVWSVGAVLKEAERWALNGPVLATFDAPLGVPESYLAVAARVRAWQLPQTFLELLAQAHGSPKFFDATTTAADWTIEQPFFSVPAGVGGLTSYRDAAAGEGVNLYRAIDKATGAKTLFAKSGIPGSVGSGTCALWRELGPLLAAERNFSVWPFEGEMEKLLESSPVVVGEIYPRAAYATALVDGPIASRAPLALAKTQGGVRRDAIATLQFAQWVRELGVTIENLAEAEANEDDFDACITAAALLRCVLEKLPLCSPHLHLARAEGGILGTGSINLALPEQTFGRVSNERRAPKERTPHVAARGTVGDGTRLFRCPIPGCVKEYIRSRGGWDAHVGSVRSHPRWHPELTSAERKRQFEVEFPEFFT